MSEDALGLDGPPVGADVALVDLRLDAESLVDGASGLDGTPALDVSLDAMALTPDIALEEMAPEDMALDLDVYPGDMSPEPDLMPAPDMEWDLGPFPDLGPIGPEVCNGLDDDRDGIVDNAPICGRTVAQGCRVYLGWAENNAGPDSGSPTWGHCPGREVDEFDEKFNVFEDIACRGTHGTGRFYCINMPVFDDVDDNDDIGLAFRCDAAPPAVGRWYQRHCRAYIGQADNNAAQAMESWDDWGGCLTGQPQAGWGCVSSGGDGLFHRLDLTGNVDGGDAFGVAFRCDDPMDPVRAAAATQSVAVIFSWDDDGSPPADGSATWGDCPGQNNSVVDNSGSQRCASSRFDGRFHRFETDGPVNDRDAFGIALVPHPEAP